MIEEYKKQFCEEYEILEKVYVDEKTNKELNKQVKDGGFDLDSYGEGREFCGYLYDKFDDSREYKFYTEQPAKLKDEDINKAVIFENNNHLRKIDKNINFITTVLKIYLVLTIIATIIICVLWFNSTPV